MQLKCILSSVLSGCVADDWQSSLSIEIEKLTQGKTESMIRGADKYRPTNGLNNIGKALIACCCTTFDGMIFM